jgi:hypothetical protein
MSRRTTRVPPRLVPPCDLASLQTAATMTAVHTTVTCGGPANYGETRRSYFPLPFRTDGGD